MTHYETDLLALRRPRTLIRAARLGATRYRRERDLRLTGERDAGGGQAALITRLLASEKALEGTRQQGQADYDIRRHVAVLTALIAEAAAAKFVSS